MRRLRRRVRAGLVTHLARGDRLLPLDAGGLVADEETALQVMAGLERQWATSGTATLRRTPGIPGVQARVYADTRRSGTE
ncbi:MULTISPECIES: DUF6207 family protein [Streptomyces]|uniref:Uncharacterized protein n=2 Tax=Streptomyces TaxID=1883 RepID=A0A1E7M0A3_9ACTN|nr:DUF6207 family protein [Streptomyces nanshensis]OEV21922.1 hypothetical protein AN221_02930 [Streptomyces nanshensis]